MILRKEGQYDIDLLVPKPPGDLRLKLAENRDELNERLYDIHGEAQSTMESNKDDE